MAQKKEKMVLVEGVWVIESKAAGRRAAKAEEKRRYAATAAALAQTHQKDVEKLRSEGCTESEITQHFLAENAEVAASHGFIRPARSVKVGKRQWGPTMMIH